MSKLSIWAKLYIGGTTAAAAFVLWIVLPHWRNEQTFRFLLYVATALVASNLKVTLPGITGTLSVNFVFTLVGVMDLNLPQVLGVSVASTVGQFLFRSKSRLWLRLLFNLASSTLCSSGCYAVYHSAYLRSWDSSVPILLFFSAGALFFMNTISVSGVIALTERKPLFTVWKNGFLWTASHYLVGAGLAGVFHTETYYFGWQSALLTVPVIYLVYRSYSLHLDRLEGARKHALEMGDLHWRTIEALALAIDAKDETTHDHLLRVKIYAGEIGRDLGLADIEMQALQAAALLHDIGKLAIPEHIISKPGKLTPEEFEKMKVHPVVGAEILERVRFPYPVVPIVRSHHEKWNGKGYPSGLKGEEIPIGARILSVVDTLDALASDRQYRRALPLDEAMKIVASEAGSSFDPKVVAVLQRRYIELEHMATTQAAPAEQPKLSKDIKVQAGEGPASGYAEPKEKVAGKPIDFMVSIAAARREFQSLVKIIEDLGTSLSVDETLSLLASRLKRMVPHDTIAIFLRDGDVVVPAYVNGEDARYFQGARLPVGEGLTGWVVENRKPIVNGNPNVEAGGEGSLRSAISVPLEAGGEVMGALTLYSLQTAAFTSDDLRGLLAIGPKTGLALANALKHQETAVSAASDDLTGLPNTKSLIRNLADHIERAEQSGDGFAVVLMDLDGFKDVNDRFGHLTGNRVLQRVGEALRANCRETDSLARIGGDEFVVVMPHIPPDDVSAKVELLAEAITEAGAEECGEEIVSLSAGEAYYPQDGRDAEQLLAKADQRMYRSKQMRRSLRISRAAAEMAAAS